MVPIRWLVVWRVAIIPFTLPEDAPPTKSLSAGAASAGTLGLGREARGRSSHFATT